MRFVEAARSFPPGTTPMVRRKNWNAHARIKLHDVSEFASQGREWAIGLLYDLGSGICGGEPIEIPVFEIDDGSDQWEQFVLAPGHHLCLVCSRICGPDCTGVGADVVMVRPAPTPGTPLAEGAVCGDHECRAKLEPRGFSISSHGVAQTCGTTSLPPEALSEAADALVTDLEHAARVKRVVAEIDLARAGINTLEVQAKDFAEHPQEILRSLLDLTIRDLVSEPKLVESILTWRGRVKAVIVFGPIRESS